MKNRILLCILMSIIIFFVSVFQYSKVYASYEEDDKIFDFMSEFIKQRNVVNQVKVVYDNYVKNGISPSNAFDFAVGQVGTLITDTAALTNAVKNTWYALTGTEKSNLIDAYNDVSSSSNTVFNIPINTHINLNIPVFDSDYRGTPIVSLGSSDVMTVVDVSTFYEQILPPYCNPNSTPYNLATTYSSWYSSYCYLIDVKYDIPVNTPPTSTRRRGFFRSTTEPLSFAILSANANSKYIRCYGNSPQFFCTVALNSNDVSYADTIEFLSYTGVAPDSVYPAVTSINEGIYSNVSVSYGGSYYVIPNKVEPVVSYETIVNNYFTTNDYIDNSVNYYPYTNNINNFYDMPNDVDWLDELKKVITGTGGDNITIYEITINNNNYYGDDEPDEPVPDDPDKPVAPVESPPEGWFDGILVSISGIFSFLNPTSDDFFLKVAFVPSDDFMQSEILRIRDSAGEKIPMIGQIFDIISKITVLLNSPFIDDSPPSFNITLPDYYGGGTYSIIDFSYFNNYRSLIHGVISVTCFYYFIRKLLRRLPAIILH